MVGKLQCPKCTSTELDVCAYESMVVLSSDHALFTMICPVCPVKVSTIQAIPAQLKAEVQIAAREVGAGMGRE